MLWRLLREALWRRRGRVAAALLAVVVGTSLSTALLAVSADITTRMGQELRSYGANILVTPRSERLEIDVAGVSYTPPGEAVYLDEGDLPKLKTIFWRNNIVGFAPYLSVPIQVAGPAAEPGPTAAVLTGAWFDREFAVPRGVALSTGFGQQESLGEGLNFSTGVKATAPWWRVQGDWPGDQALDSALVGSSLARRLKVKAGDTLSIQYEGRRSVLRVTGLVTSGGVEDDQLVAPLPLAQSLLGKPGAVGRVLVSARVLPREMLAADIRDKDPAEMTPKEYEKWYCSPVVEAVSKQVEEAMAGSQARPVRQIAEAEGAFLSKVRWLLMLTTAFALAISALGVMATMNTTVLERRREVGLMKALGAQDSQVAVIFLSEAATIGITGGLLGYLAGSALAHFIGKNVFDTTIATGGDILTLAVLLALTISILGSSLPVHGALKVDPVGLLKE